MASIGSWWLAKHEALVGEAQVWSCAANRTQSPTRAVGGQLLLTNRRLLFSPHLLDYASGGAKWAVDLASITDVGIQPKGGDRLGGGLRDRLRLQLKDGQTELFVVNHLDDVVTRLQAATSAVV